MPWQQVLAGREMAHSIKAVTRLNKSQYLTMNGSTFELQIHHTIAEVQKNKAFPNTGFLAVEAPCRMAVLQ